MGLWIKQGDYKQYFVVAPFAAFNLFAAIVTALVARFGCLDALRIDTARTRCWFANGFNTNIFVKCLCDSDKSSVNLPLCLK